MNSENQTILLYGSCFSILSKFTGFWLEKGSLDCSLKLHSLIWHSASLVPLSWKKLTEKVKVILDLGQKPPSDMQICPFDSVGFDEQT